MSHSSALDLVAKLLANENINVIQGNVRTASFNIETRTLTLPHWQQITPTVNQLLVGHEVGHALYTTAAYTEALSKRLTFKHAHSYLNILEDARVEKLMKRKYPGIRKVFNMGYQELHSQDFFEVNNRDISSLHLMDKINLYFKVGFGVGIKFTAEESVFVRRAESLETIEETITLAEDIFKYLQLQAESELNQPTAASVDVEDSDEDDEEDEDEDDEEYYRDAISEEGEVSPEHRFKSSDSSPPSGADTAPTTNASFDQKLVDLADVGTDYVYWDIMPIAHDPIISFKEILENMRERLIDVTTHDSYKDVREFKQATTNNVNYLIKEFELKKAASLYKRSETSKAGTLDHKKLWSYKINDDLFKRVTVTKQGKNHGMVFLLDWSGSMYRTLSDTIDQLINLVMFCRRINIPFEVFAFTDGTVSSKWTPLPHSFRMDNIHNRRIDVSDCQFALLELFSSKMSASEFNSMVTALKFGLFRSKYDLNGTPLNEALVFCYHYIDKFQRRHNIEKTSFITLTDGGGSALSMFSQSRWKDHKVVRVKHFIKDQHTKTNVSVDTTASAQTKALIKMIKTRYQCAVVGFYVLRNNKSDIYEAIRNHLDTRNKNETIMNRIKDDFRSQGYASLANTGRDDLFLVPASSTAIVDEELKVDSSSSARAISTKLAKFFKTKKTSRILLSKFIDYVS